MPDREHHYTVTTRWTGDRGTGTSAYRAYDRTHEITSGAKPPIPGSSDPAFLGDASRWNPEELLVSAASTCHMLWYLHLCSANGIVVTDYTDNAEGTMADNGKTGLFTRVVLRPNVGLAEGSDATRARALHHEAHASCYIANSVNFPIDCEPV